MFALHTGFQVVEQDGDGREHLAGVADAVAAGHEYAEEGGVEHERHQPLEGERPAEQLARGTGKGGDVHAELELQDEPGDGPHDEPDGDDARPETAQLLVDDSLGPYRPPGEGHEEGPKPHRDDGEDDVDDRGEGELQSTDERGSTTGTCRPTVGRLEIELIRQDGNGFG
jgi:hypothetical protein